MDSVNERPNDFLPFQQELKERLPQPDVMAPTQADHTLL